MQERDRAKKITAEDWALITFVVTYVLLWRKLIMVVVYTPPPISIR
jgi:hypothetical protein